MNCKAIQTLLERERNNCETITRSYVSSYMNFYYTYVLESLKDKSLYIGYTADLKNRIKRHNAGLNKATKPHIPYRLIHFEGFLDRIDAKRREVYLKSGWGLKSIHKMLEKYFKIK